MFFGVSPFLNKLSILHTFLNNVVSMVHSVAPETRLRDPRSLVGRSLTSVKEIRDSKKVSHLGQSKESPRPLVV